MYRGSLAALCERLGVTRDDKCEHQAGSDSKITAKCFIELRKLSTKQFNVIVGSHGEIFGLSRLKKSPVNPAGKDALPRIFPGTNVKIAPSGKQQYEIGGSSEHAFEAKTNSVSPPQNGFILRSSYDLQDPTYVANNVGGGLGLDFDNGLDLD
jgi:hypothetical protein